MVAHFMPKHTGKKLHLILLTKETEHWALNGDQQKLEIMPDVIVTIPQWFLRDDQ